MFKKIKIQISISLAIVSCLLHDMELVAKLGAPGRAMGALNYWAISPESYTFWERASTGSLSESRDYKWTRLTGQWACRILLPLPSRQGTSGTPLHARFFTWVLELSPQTLILVQQVPYSRILLSSQQIINLLARKFFKGLKTVERLCYGKMFKLFFLKIRSNKEARYLLLNIFIIRPAHCNRKKLNMLRNVKKETSCL